MTSQGEKDQNPDQENDSNSETEDDDEPEIDPASLEKWSLTAGDTSNPEEQLVAVQAVRKFISTKNNQQPIDYVINSSLLPTLVECLKCHNTPVVQFEACWALTNVAAGASYQTHQVVSAGAVPLFLKLLNSPADNVSEQALWALGNIIGDGPFLRDFVINHGIINSLLSFIKPGATVSILRTVAWVIVNLCRKVPPPSDNALHSLLVALNVLIHHTDTAVVMDTMYALTCLASGEEQIQMVINSGVVPKLIPFLGVSEVKLSVSALHAIGSIATGTEQQSQILIDENVLAYMPDLLTSPEQKIRKKAVWLMGNITGGSQSQIQCIINEGLVPLLINNLSTGELPTRKEAAYAVCNIMMIGNSEQIDTLIIEGVIPPFIELLHCDDIELKKVLQVSFATMAKKRNFVIAI